MIIESEYIEHARSEDSPLNSKCDKHSNERISSIDRKQSVRIGHDGEEGIGLAPVNEMDTYPRNPVRFPRRMIVSAIAI